MDRARSWSFPRRIPRMTIAGVAEQERVEDKQMLLNETWAHFCDRIPHSHEVERTEDRQKWVTETWDEYERRIVRREVAVDAFFRKLKTKQQAADADAAAREARAAQCLSDITTIDQRRRSRLLPPLHSLEHTAEAVAAETRRREQVELLKDERSKRDALEFDELRRSTQMRERERLEKRALQEELQRKERERIEAERQRQEEIRRAAEAAEAERIRKEEEERRRRHEEEMRVKEEQARKRKEVEDRRKAEAQRMKEERDRIRREEEEEEKRKAAQKEQWSAGGGLTPTPSGVGDRPITPRDPEAMWAQIRKEQQKSMDGYLSALRPRIEAAKSEADFAEILKVVPGEVGAFLSTFAIYIGMRGGGLFAPADDPTTHELQYKYASPACGPKLRSGECFLSTENHANCPTIKTVLGKMEEVFMADPRGHAEVEYFGDPQNPPAAENQGDFFALPLLGDEKHRAFGVLSADTLNCNGEREQWKKVFSNDPARRMDDNEKKFLRDLAALLSEGIQRLQHEHKTQKSAREATAAEPAFDIVNTMDTQIDDTGSDPMTKLLGGMLKAAYNYLSKDLKGLNLYITFPDHSGQQLMVTHQYAHGTLLSSSKSAAIPDLAPHTNLIGKVISKPTTESPSFALMDTALPASGAYPHRYIADVSVESSVGLYQSTEKDSAKATSKHKDCLFLAPIFGASGKKAVTALFGVECGADPGLSKDQIATLLRLCEHISGLYRPLRMRRQMVAISKQAIQWLEATTGAKNIYISISEGGSGLRYIAASRGQEFLIGKRLAPTEGVSHDVLKEHASTNVLHIKDLTAAPNVKIWNPANQGGAGEFVATGVRPTSANGPRLFAELGSANLLLSKGESLKKVTDGTGGAGGGGGLVIGMDTLGGNTGKKTGFTDEDKRVLGDTATLMGAVLDEIADGTIDDTQDGRVLDIEKVLGGVGIRFYKKVLMRVLSQLGMLTKDQIQEMARYSSPPPTVTQVVRATLIVLRHKPSKVKEWSDCRPHIKVALVEKMVAMDPTQTHKRPIVFFRRARSMLKGLTMQTVFEKGSLPASLFFQWSYVSIQLRYTSDLLRRKLKAGILDLDDGPEEEEEEPDKEVPEKEGADEGEDTEDGEAEGPETARGGGGGSGEEEGDESAAPTKTQPPQEAEQPQADGSADPSAGTEAVATPATDEQPSS